MEPHSLKYPLIFRHDCPLCAGDGDDCHRVDEQCGDGLQQDRHQQGWSPDQGGVCRQLSEGPRNISNHC